MSQIKSKDRVRDLAEVDTKHDLFRKTTGITVEYFRYLVDLGLLKIENIDGYILKFFGMRNSAWNLIC
jgi:hypothetical protein